MNDRKRSKPSILDHLVAMSMNLPGIIPTKYDKMTEEEEEEYIDAIIEEVRAEDRAREQHEE